MAEYQYYEFLAIDRPLDARQLAELRALSTRARISPSRFVTPTSGATSGVTAGTDDPVLRRVPLHGELGHPAADAASAIPAARPVDCAALLPHRLRLCMGAGRSSSSTSLVRPGRSWEDEEYGEESLGSIIRRARNSPRAICACCIWHSCCQSNLESLPTTMPSRRSRGDGGADAPLRSLADFLRLDEDLIAVAAEASEEQKDSSPSPRS